MPIYRNRYNDEFIFEFNERGNIDWKPNKDNNLGFEYCRYGFIDNPNDITMVDPSGGPMISINDDMSLFGDEFRDKKCIGFISHKGYYEIVVNK